MDCAWEFVAPTEISAATVSKNRPILRTIISPLNGIASGDVPFVGRDGPGSPFVGVAYHRLARTARKILALYAFLQNVLLLQIFHDQLHHPIDHLLRRPGIEGVARARPDKFSIPRRGRIKI